MLAPLPSRLMSSAPSASPLAPRWVSIDCPRGDLTLTLAADGTFALHMAYWDEESEEHTHSELLEGRWNAQGRSLSLLAPDTTLRYVQDTTLITVGYRRHRIPSLRWAESTHATFADTYPLGEEKAFDVASRDALLETGGV